MGAQVNQSDSIQGMVCKFCRLPRGEPRYGNYKEKIHFLSYALLITIFLLVNFFFRFGHYLENKKSSYKQKGIPALCFCRAHWLVGTQMRRKLIRHRDKHWAESSRGSHRTESMNRSWSCHHSSHHGHFFSLRFRFVCSSVNLGFAIFLTLVFLYTVCFSREEKLCNFV